MPNVVVGDEQLRIALRFEATFGGRPLRFRGIDRIRVCEGRPIERHAAVQLRPLLTRAVCGPNPGVRTARWARQGRVLR